MIFLIFMIVFPLSEDLIRPSAKYLNTLKKMHDGKHFLCFKKNITGIKETQVEIGFYFRPYFVSHACKISNKCSALSRNMLICDVPFNRIILFINPSCTLIIVWPLYMR